MIFVDTNVFMFAVGRAHPLKDEARAFFAESLDAGTPLVTSVEVVQELLHAYLPVERLPAFDAALTLVESCTQEVWDIGLDDLRFARALADSHPGLCARDLVHLACCQRRDVRRIKTFDRSLAAAF